MTRDFQRQVGFKPFRGWQPLAHPPPGPADTPRRQRASSAQAGRNLPFLPPPLPPPATHTHSACRGPTCSSGLERGTPGGGDLGGHLSIPSCPPPGPLSPEAPPALRPAAPPHPCITHRQRTKKPCLGGSDELQRDIFLGGWGGEGGGPLPSSALLHHQKGVL